MYTLNPQFFDDGLSVTDEEYDLSGLGEESL